MKGELREAGIETGEIAAAVLGDGLTRGSRHPRESIGMCPAKTTWPGRGRGVRRGEEVVKEVVGDQEVVAVVVKDVVAKGDGRRRTEMIRGVRLCRDGRDLRPRSWIKICMFDAFHQQWVEWGG